MIWTYDGKMSMEADFVDTVRLAPELRTAPVWKTNRITFNAAAGDRDLLEKFVRVIFERELHRYLSSPRGDPGVEPEFDPLDDQLRALMGRLFPRSGRFATILYSKLRRGLDKHRLRIRVLREFYRTLYRFAWLQAEPPAVRGTGTDPIKVEEGVRLFFFRMLASFHGSEPAHLDLDRLDRLVRSTVDWCLSILPYHAPDLREQDPLSLLSSAVLEAG